MSKELIRPEDFGRVNVPPVEDDASLEISPEQLQEMSDLYEGMFENFAPGKTLIGKIVSVSSDGVLIDVGYKSHGFIPKYEFGVHELKELKAGGELEVMLDTLENPYGNIVVSYEKAKVRRAWDTIVKLYEENKPVQGVVTHKVKGGLSVDIGVPAFLPGSQIDLHRVTDFDHFVGQTITANILKINQKRGNVIVSRRKYMSDQRAGVRKKVLDELELGQIIPGIVKNITNYGVFVDIGGVDGLLHITDMTWGRISHPSELVKLGDNITVKVLSFDKENEKISLDLKTLTDDPWKEIVDTLKVGEKVTGRVSSISDYGLFVEITKGVEGLVHISEISWTDRITNPSDHFKVGQNIDVRVVSLDLDNHRMSLSIKQLQDNPWKTLDEEFSVGQKIKGTISNITDFGIFVRLRPGIDGLVHISDLSWTEHINHPSDRYHIRQEVEAIVLSMDKDNKKISLGIKQLDRDPWENVETEYPNGSIIEGTVSKITNFGAFIRLDNGIEGLLHNTVLMEDQGKKAEELLKVDQKSKFRVINVSSKDHRLGLSMNLEARSKPREKTSEAKPKAESRKAKADAQPKTTSSAPKMKTSLQMALAGAMKQQKSDDTAQKTEAKTPKAAKKATKAAAAKEEPVVEAEETTKGDTDGN